MEKALIDRINFKVNEPKAQQTIQSIIGSKDFYFQKGKDVLQKWLDMKVSDRLKNRLLELSKNYDEIKKVAETDTEIQSKLELFFKIISYCDKNAKDKNTFNNYNPKRCLATAFVNMNNWVEHLILFKFKHNESVTGSTENAFNYLLDPQNNATILSENHRKLISKNLFKKDFISANFVNDLKTFFHDLNIHTKNDLNYTYLLSTIIYFIEDEWKEKVVALMTSDGTGLQDKPIEELKKLDAFIVWNSKKPSDAAESVESLRKVLTEENHFNIYYCSNGYVNYKATITDFAENQQQLTEKNWNGNINNIRYYQPQFVDYSHDKKTAKIVFLANKFEEITPIPVSEFKFCKEYDEPKRDNLSPVKYEPETVTTEVDSSKKINNITGYPMKKPLNQILFGPPGTGKTYNTVNKAIAIVNPGFVSQERNEIKREFNRLMQKKQIVFTTFHQSMSYEDFIEGIKPIPPKSENGSVIYKIQNGIFKEIVHEARKIMHKSIKIGTDVYELTEELFEDCYYQFVETLVNTNEARSNCVLKTVGGNEFGLYKNASGSITIKAGEKMTKMSATLNELTQVLFYGKSPTYKSYENIIIEKILEDKSYTESSSDNTQKKFVLIIDEVNRGNVSQIFGELITLIEDDKRLGNEEALEVTLPYSKEKFGVPSNLYIIGTMNTADRSVEALDAALRRRFSFEEIPPQPDLIASHGKLKEEKGVIRTIDLPLLLGTINKRLEKLLDKDHQIGHSYFMNVTSLDELKVAFQNKIIPLLQEYFFGDYGKIGLVLGKGFVRLKDNGDNLDCFAEFDSERASDFKDREVYEIIDYETKREESYYIKVKSTSGKDTVINFKNAIKLLMKQDIE